MACPVVCGPGVSGGGPRGDPSAPSGQPIQPTRRSSQALTPEGVARAMESRDTGRDSRGEMRMRLFDRQGRVRERGLSIARAARRRAARATRRWFASRTPTTSAAPRSSSGSTAMPADERFLYSAGARARAPDRGAGEAGELRRQRPELRGHRRPRRRRLHLRVRVREHHLDRARRRPPRSLGARVARERQGRRVPALGVDRPEGIAHRRCTPTSSTAATSGRRCSTSSGSSAWTASGRALDLVVANEREKTRTELTTTSLRYNVGLSDDDFSRRAAGAGRAMSKWVAEFVFRFRRPALRRHRPRLPLLRAEGQLHRDRQRPHACGCRRPIPSTVTYERFRKEFGGQRT